MNYIQHLTAFLDLVKHDNRLTPQHVTLYIALFYQWNRAYFQNPISISRSDIMEMSRIGSAHTYAKCIKQLHAWKYIRYEPSFNPQKPSLVHLCIFDTGISVKNDTGTSTGRVSKMLPSINNTNKKKQEIESAQAQISNSILSNMKTQELTPENATSKNRISEVPPPLSHVKIYFSEKNFSDQEAEKFFNYFESTGWLVGGRTKMRDWKAAARNWMLNIPKFAKAQKPTSPDPIRLNLHKSYDEPL